MAAATDVHSRVWCTFCALLAACALQIPVALAQAEVATEPKRPNVLIWLMDDVGYGQLGAFGGPVETSTLERLAAQGLRFAAVVGASAASRGAAAPPRETARRCDHEFDVIVVGCILAGACASYEALGAEVSVLVMDSGGAATIAELERSLGIPSPALQQAVTTYNQYAAKGEDPLFHKNLGECIAFGWVAGARAAANAN